MKKTYLGDSVYAETDQATGALVLTTDNGTGHPSNIIHLESAVLDALIRATAEKHDETPVPTEHRKPVNLEYYEEEIARIPLTGKYPAALQLNMDGKKTRWLDVNVACATALVKALALAFGSQVLPSRILDAGAVKDISIYHAARALNIEIDHHESDLYMPVNETTKRLVANYRFKNNVTTFHSAIDNTLWYDVPFAYVPFWQEKTPCASN